MDNNATSNSPSPEAYQAVYDALWAHRDRAAAQAIALDAIRAWRHAVPRTASVDFSALDAALDAAALGDDVPLQRIVPPANLPEAVTAHRTVMDARRQALAAARLVWDSIEAAAIRDIDRHLHADPTAGR